ncbi:unnamed protein product [Rotaria socialis]|uniref:Uncharacterized protein n=1 Tax=Rotaria socialis TaxID=392032 RepID=A0A817LIE3_9BILA|nr:unnamed protein product [Rotaria socialis]CAF3304767.1 unnamed protein product [Rotaria socialis]CAF3460712.1 unnamed protein product [Rotaria socialis]CAF4203496.1 unnamed protein product [Rotaria socialis]CAF4225601.1 unnamed protein product [Rotaria socialis]
MPAPRPGALAFLIANASVAGNNKKIDATTSKKCNAGLFEDRTNDDENIEAEYHYEDDGPPAKQLKKNHSGDKDSSSSTNKN